MADHFRTAATGTHRQGGGIIHLPHKVSLTHFLKHDLPSFCWQSYKEIVTMMEQIDEDVNVHSLSVTLTILSKAGHIDFKPSTYSRRGAGGKVLMYKGVIRSNGLDSLLNK